MMGSVRFLDMDSSGPLVACFAHWTVQVWRESHAPTNSPLHPFVLCPCAVFARRVCAPMRSSPHGAGTESPWLGLAAGAAVVNFEAEGGRGPPSCMGCGHCS